MPSALRESAFGRVKEALLRELLILGIAGAAAYGAFVYVLAEPEPTPRDSVSFKINMETGKIVTFDPETGAEIPIEGVAREVYRGFTRLPRVDFYPPDQGDIVSGGILSLIAWALIRADPVRRRGWLYILMKGLLGASVAGTLSSATGVALLGTGFITKGPAFTPVGAVFGFCEEFLRASLKALTQSAGEEPSQGHE